MSRQWQFGLIQLALIWVATTAIAAQRFLPDDPIRSDPDDLPIECPQVRELSPTFDALINSLGAEGHGRSVRATNVNTLDRVPDSSWFTNRIGLGNMSREDIVRGGVDQKRPDLSRIRIVGARLTTPNGDLLIEDRQGLTYLVRFDRRHYPNLATGAELISNRFLHAAGYRVLPLTLVRIDPRRFEIDPAAMVEMIGGRAEPLTPEFVDSLLEESAVDANGLYRANAGLLPPGRFVGQFQFFGTRVDDPNDIFLHENRRELRALELFAAWLNHTACNGAGTMDLWVAQHNRGHLHHYLADLGSSLGSGRDLNRRTVPKDPRAGYEYSLVPDGRAILKSAFSLGLWERPWLKLDYPYPELDEIGRIEAEYFHPGRWKPDYPNPAFRHQRPDDALWGAEILSQFTDEVIRAVVEMAEYSDPRATEYLTSTLIRRRDKLLDFHLRRINPLVDFRIEGDTLAFRNLGSDRGIDQRVSYEYEWFTFDNLTEATQATGPRRYTGFSRLDIPSTQAGYLKVHIVTRSDTVPAWQSPVDVYLRLLAEGWEVVGVDRFLAPGNPG